MPSDSGPPFHFRILRDYASIIPADLTEFEDAYELEYGFAGSGPRTANFELAWIRQVLIVLSRCPRADLKEYGAVHFNIALERGELVKLAFRLADLRTAHPALADGILTRVGPEPGNWTVVGESHN